MYIYTLFYKDTGLYNKQIFVLPNDLTAKKAMKIQLMDAKNVNFINEAKLGNTELKQLCEFEEIEGILDVTGKTVCNLKELLDDDTGDMQPANQ